MKVLKDIAYGDNKTQLLDMYLPDNGAFGTIVYFHGGGLTDGGKCWKALEEMAESFVKAGYGFISCDYTLYPDARFPVYIRDCAKAVAYVKAHIKELGGNGKLFVSGQSAGAWLSLMLCVAPEYLAAEGVAVKDIDGWLIESGQTTSHFNILTIEDGAHPLSQRLDERAPLYYVSDKTAFSGMLLMYYSEDMPCRKEQNELFYKAVKCFNPEADITPVMLKGTHCIGSAVKDKDGEYPYVKECLKWLER